MQGVSKLLAVGCTRRFLNYSSSVSINQHIVETGCQVRGEAEVGSGLAEIRIFFGATQSGSVLFVKEVPFVLLHRKGKDGSLDPIGH